MAGRVLRIITRLNRGGPLRQLTALVPALKPFGWEGPVVTGVTEPHEPDGTEELEAAGAEVIRLRSLRRGVSPGSDARAFGSVQSLVRRLRPDVVHTHLSKAGVLGRKAAFLAGVPTVHTFHGHHLTAPWPLDVMTRFAERALAPVTAAAIALTPRQRRDLVTTHRVLPAHRVRVVGPGLDVADVRGRAAAGPVPRPMARLRETGLPVFLWAGRFVPVKDPLGLVDAAARSLRAFRLVLLGDGPLREEVRERIRDRGLSEVVRCPGAVDEVAPWSSRSEGAPLLVLEAKALERAALVTTVGGVPDLVSHGEDGWWVPPGDVDALARGMDALASDRDRLRAMGRAAGADIDERFGGARLGRETALLYEIVRRSRRGT
ncbi:MAG: glycosyltransferase [Planctomycetota bacterium]